MSLKNFAYQCLTQKPIAKAFLPVALKLHNWSYRLAGLLSESVDPSGVHPKHRIMDYHDWFVSQIQPQWKVLDLGCGNGSLTADLVKKCSSVTGIDLNPKNIEKAKKRVPEARFVCGDATLYPFQEHFDAIVLSNVLENIDGRIEFLKRLHTVADRVLIRVPLIDRDWITLYKKELNMEYRLDPTHMIEYTKEDLYSELKASNWIATGERTRFGEIYVVCTPQKQLNA